MTEGEEVKRRRRRSSQEIQRLVAEFRTSGLRQSEFCRIHGLTHGTLQRGLRRERMGSGSQSEVKGLVAVELTDGEALVRRRPEECRCGLEVRLSQEELTLLLGGIDLKQTKTRNWYRKTVSESEKIEKEAGN